MPNETELAEAIVQSSEGESPDGLPAVAEPEEISPPASSEEGAAAAEESTEKGEEQVTESGTEQQAETPEQMQARITELEAVVAQRDGTIKERTGAYNGLMSELQRTQQQVQSADAMEAQQDQARVAERAQIEADENAWADIVVNPQKFAAWLNERDGLRDRATERNMRGQMFAMRAQEINTREGQRVFSAIDGLRKDAKMSDAEWETFRAEFGERRDASGAVVQPAFHMFGNDFARIEKTATEIIRGRYAPQAVAESAANAERNATSRVQKTMMTQLPSGGGAGPQPQESSDDEFERQVVEFDDTNG